MNGLGQFHFNKEVIYIFVHINAEIYSVTHGGIIDET